MEYQEYSGAEIIIKLLERQGITTVAGIPGGTSLPIYDALRDSSIKHVLTRHEQGAGFLAQGMARVSGKAAVCLATSGPGATNLLTAIADAKLDSIPLVAITGQVSRPMIGTDAFQEVDTYGLTIPITKHNFFVHNTEDLLKIIPKAFEIAESGRPGPVVVDVPKDVPDPVHPCGRMARTGPAGPAYGLQGHGHSPLAADAGRGGTARIVRGWRHHRLGLHGTAPRTGTSAVHSRGLHAHGAGRLSSG